MSKLFLLKLNNCNLLLTKHVEFLLVEHCESQRGIFWVEPLGDNWLKPYNLTAKGKAHSVFCITLGIQFGIQIKPPCVVAAK